MKAIRPSKLNLTASILDGDVRSLFITAPHAGAGVTTSAYSLANSLGSLDLQNTILDDSDVGSYLPHNRNDTSNVLGFNDLIYSGGRDVQLNHLVPSYTLLIDGNPGGGSLTDKLRLKGEIGLSDLILSREGGVLPKAIRRLDDMPFHFIPHGQQKLNASLGGERAALKQLIEKLKGLYKYIIYDGPDVHSNSESLAIASAFDGVVMVVRNSETRMEVAKAAKDSLTQSGANVVGAIFNRRQYYIPKWIYDSL
ncbi:MAG: hypothetical protein JKY01_09490 [Pseudomonadales bacterium]|nr:hypothetical protein [Pseudomonadales bacterium]